MLWRDGQILEGTRAPLDLTDRGLTLGDGLFDTALALGGRVAFAEAHVRRLADSARAFDIPVDPARFAEAMRALAARGGRLAIRTTLTRGAGPRGLAPPAAVEPTLFAVAAPSARAAAFAPVRLLPTMIARNDTSPAARHKTLGYLDAVLAARDAAAAGFDEALFCNTRGHVTCAGTGNVFGIFADDTGARASLPPLRGRVAPEGGRERGATVQDGAVGAWHPEPSLPSPPLLRRVPSPADGGGTAVEPLPYRLVTPPLTDGVLTGIVRAEVLRLAHALGLAVEERSLTPAELLGAQAVFVTNSLRLLAPVTAIGETAFASPGHPAVAALSQALCAAVAASCGVPEEAVA